MFLPPVIRRLNCEIIELFPKVLIFISSILGTNLRLLDYLKVKFYANQLQKN